MLVLGEGREKLLLLIIRGNASSVTAVPGEGYQFAGWSDGVKTAVRRDNNIKSDIAVTAVFEKITFTVVYVAHGGGSISGEQSQAVAYGENTSSVTAVPGEGYQFAGWSDGIKTATRRDNNVKSSMTVTAVFEKVNFTVAYSHGLLET